MLKYRGRHVMRAGFIGVVLIVLIIAIGLQPERLVAWATTVRYQAQFTHAGGLLVGNDVKVSGVKVGSVSEVALRDGKALVTFSVNATVALGSETTAHIRTGSLLGQRILTLESSGPTVMRPNAVIPASRTASPYSLTDAIGDLTTNTSGTDTQELNQSLDTLSATLDQIAPQLGPAFDGLTRLSQSLNSRDATLGELLKHTSNVTAVLAKRSDQLNTLILNANDLVSVLAERRQAIVDLLANTSAVAEQLSGLIADNEKQLAPTLEKLNSVTAMLQKNRDNIAKALPGLAKYQITLGETVSTGFYYNAFVPNLTLNQTLQPFLDYAFGLRRGTNNGQPPDNAGPRAEFPLPFNAIPPQQAQPGGGR
jgi:phospholipid/cholesterol/gamma-HCH transport system substrate-binding protein